MQLDEDLRVHVVCVSQAKFHYTVQLATSSRAGRKLDNVMEFGRELVCDLLASKIASWNMA